MSEHPEYEYRATPEYYAERAREEHRRAEDRDRSAGGRGAWRAGGALRSASVEPEPGAAGDGSRRGAADDAERDRLTVYVIEAGGVTPAPIAKPNTRLRWSED